MMKLNSKIISTNIVVHYVAIFIATVAGYWLIYWVTMWVLFGVANVSKSESIMNWLADKNYFYLARESTLSNYYRQHSVVSISPSNPNLETIEEAVKYLKQEIWKKEEMDSIQCLVGLYDELNEYDTIGISRRDELIDKSPELARILSALGRCDMRHLRGRYNKREDTQIRPRFYLQLIEREINRQEKLMKSAQGKGASSQNHKLEVEHQSNVNSSERW